MEWLGLGIALLGAFIAVFIPLFVEYSRRPELRIERADDLNIEHRPPKQRIVHIRVVNLPLRGLRGRWLVRNTAAGCTVHFTFVSKSDGTRISIPGRWSGNPEPFTYVTVPGASAASVLITQIVDQTKIPQTRVIDVSPGEAGQTVGIAIKTEGQAEAFGFASESYLHDLENPDWRLPHREYDVEVVAEAGGLRSKPARYVLRNDGTSYTGLTLATAQP